MTWRANVAWFIALFVRVHLFAQVSGPVRIYRPTNASGPIKRVTDQYITDYRIGSFTGITLIVRGVNAGGAAESALVKLPNLVLRESKPHRRLPVACYHILWLGSLGGARRIIGCISRSDDEPINSTWLDWSFDTRSQMFTVREPPDWSPGFPARHSPNMSNRRARVFLPLAVAPETRSHLRASGAIIVKDVKEADVVLLPNWADHCFFDRHSRPAALRSVWDHHVTVMWEQDLR